jgi:hypothetical protein
MSIPTVVFLDTSVLAGQQFNFASTAFMTFVPAAKKAGLKLVLPDPTEREVKRQIKERSQEALDALELARKRAPFLEKWTSFPKKSFPSVDTWEVTRVATNEWNAFLSQFSVVRLGYELLDVKAVMNWYDHIVPPSARERSVKSFLTRSQFLWLTHMPTKTAVSWPLYRTTKILSWRASDSRICSISKVSRG